MEPSGIEFCESMAAEPEVEDWQLLWPVKLNDWFRAITALANSVSPLSTACRTATNPVMVPSTKIVATKTYSVAINAPQSSCHHLRNAPCIRSSETPFGLGFPGMRPLSQLAGDRRVRTQGA